MSVELYIVIIGGGFSGVVVVIELLCLVLNGVCVMLLELCQFFGVGVVYFIVELMYWINVLVVCMQLVGDEEGVFDYWYCYQFVFIVDVQVLCLDGFVYFQCGQFGCYVVQCFVDVVVFSGGWFCYLCDWVFVFYQGMVIIDGGLQFKVDLLVLVISYLLFLLLMQVEVWCYYLVLIVNLWQFGVFDVIVLYVWVVVMGIGLIMVDMVVMLDWLGYCGSIVVFLCYGLLLCGNFSGVGVIWSGDYQQGSLCQCLCQICFDVVYVVQQGLSWQVVLDVVCQQG